jgi:hypothetical protein
MEVLCTSVWLYQACSNPRLCCRHQSRIMAMYACYRLNILQPGSLRTLLASIGIDLRGAQCGRI